MRTIAVLAMALATAPASAEEKLNFDVDKLCQWQFENNSMDVEECKTLEAEGKSYVAAHEAEAAPERRAACVAETLSYAGDPGFASYTVYSACLKDGPGSL